MPSQSKTLALAAELRGASMRFARRLRQERPANPDLSLSDHSALGTLNKGGPMTPGELAAHERMRPPSMTRIAAKLEELGLVERSAHPTDGRQVMLSVSEAGRALIKENRRRRDAWLTQRLLELEPEEREALARATQILDRLASS